MDCYHKALKYLKEKYFKGKKVFYFSLTRDDVEDDVDFLIYILLSEWSLSEQSKKELCEIINLIFIPEYVTNTENV